ncbi:hypothetical protein C7B61_11245 [filamentous cyanobacterium CCP1]|nr:hypothetical protein C7B76_08890 [filamentous cyanobacterium CCP2]PSB65472.1 hypothetical protein C7B61_11245 [filamentous cyanobacterium CCP1]
MSEQPATISDLETLEALRKLEALIQNAYSRLEQLLATVQDYEAAQELLQELRQSQAALETSWQHLAEATVQLQTQQQTLESSTGEAQATIEAFVPLIEEIRALGGAAKLQEQIQLLKTALEASENSLNRSQQDPYQSISTELQQVSGQMSHLRQTQKHLIFATMTIAIIALIGLLT